MTRLFLLTYGGRRAVARWHPLRVRGAQDGDGAGHGGWWRGWQHPGGRVVVGHLSRTLQYGSWGVGLKAHDTTQSVNVPYTEHY